MWSADDLSTAFGCLSACSDKDYFVSPLMRDRYKAQGYPDAFPQRSKTLLLFQVRLSHTLRSCRCDCRTPCALAVATVPYNLLAPLCRIRGWQRCSCWQEFDGIDVIIFGMFVQEYGSDCPPPNHRTAYLSYIDSIKYLRPPELRTLVFQGVFPLASWLGRCHSSRLPFRVRLANV